MVKIILQDDGRDIMTQDLEIDPGDIDRIVDQLRNLQISGRATFATVLACEAIAAEPPRDWPAPLNEKNSSGAKELQSRFIDSLGYQLLTMAHGQTAAGVITEISIFDAIRQVAQLSLGCGCIFRVPPMGPVRR